MLDHKDVTGVILRAAFDVHTLLGPGLLESAYAEFLCFELARRRVPFERQVPLSVNLRGVKLSCSYRLDMVVDRRVVVELKCVERLLPIHEAQLLTYLRLGGFPVGLLINFNVVTLKDGIVRRVLSRGRQETR
jgi:GxxExxY protein